MQGRAGFHHGLVLVIPLLSGNGAFLKQGVIAVKSGKGIVIITLGFQGTCIIGSPAFHRICRSLMTAGPILGNGKADVLRVLGNKDIPFCHFVPQIYIYFLQPACILGRNIHRFPGHRISRQYHPFHHVLSLHLLHLHQRMGRYFPYAHPAAVSVGVNAAKQENKDNSPYDDFCLFRMKP